MTENSEQLESTIADLEASLENQRAEANEAIIQWESRCTVLQEQIEQMEDHWNQSEVMKNIETFKDQLLAKEQRCQEGQKKIKELQTTLSAVNDELMDAKKTHSCLVEAQKNLNDLEHDHATLKRTLTNTNETLQVLQHEETQLKQSLHVEKEEKKHIKDEVKLLKEEMEVIVNNIVSEKAASEKAMQMLNDEKSHLQQVEKSLNGSQMLLGNTKIELEGVKKEKIEIESTLNNELEQLLQKNTYLEHEKVSMLESLNAGNNQSQELNLIIGQLQGELQEANDALQAHITDEVTMRATEMATEALREQVNQLRERQGFDNEALSKERTARISAEEEVDRLKTDLSLLVQVEDSPISADHLEGKVKKMTSKAAANILQRDRADIENLTKNLNKAITELKFCRKSEQDAEERAANARLHTSVCEQELSSAKSDLSILRSTLAETRKEEANIKSTLEKRIHDLERSKEKAIDSHSKSISHLKSELSQGQLEREQLMHALNESEEANSTLVYSTTVTTEHSGSSMEEIELAKLRLEKAQLLASSAENASKTEKRIREAITGNLSSTEADILEEKEKRKAVENELKNINERYDEISSELVSTKAKKSELDAQLKRTNVNELKEELHGIEKQVTSLTKINEDLKIQLITTESEAKTTCTHLTEKCRLAESKVRDLERECRNEAAVAAEVARIRDETKTFGMLSTTQFKLSHLSTHI
jgi:chromosome segregation ATPase